jgi:hypothetical protein
MGQTSSPETLVSYHKIMTMGKNPKAFMQYCNHGRSDLYVFKDKFLYVVHIPSVLLASAGAKYSASSPEVRLVLN